MAHEIDPRPLMRRLAAAGILLALPAVARREHPLEFRAWRPDDPLEAGDHGTFHPPAGGAIVRPLLVLVPLLAFDRSGRRLGYGGGYYDRTLASLRESGHTLAVGLAYSAQEFDQLPHGPHDQLLDGIATEAGFRPVSGEQA
jgi:5-formyltetrahydrofolate cyclo-ligase